MNTCLKHIIIILLLLFVQIPATAQEETANEIRKQEELLRQNPDDPNILKKLCFLYLHKADYQKAIKYGERLFKIGNEKQDYYNSVLYAHIGLGQAYIMLGDPNAYNHLGQAMLLGESAKKDSALCSVYNGMGLYASNINKDYYSALHYFFKGLDAARRSHYDELEAILLGNISNIYYLKNDTIGIQYSLKVYDMGHKQGSPYLIFIGAMTSAYMYYLLHDYDKAFTYIKETEFIMNQNDFYNKGNVYAIYGMIESAKGNHEKAIKFYQKGLASNDKNQTSTKILLLTQYAKALEKEGKNQKAIQLLHQSLSLTKHENCKIYRNEIINTLSVCYENLGLYAEALKLLRTLQQETDSIFNTDKEKIISDLRIKYDSERQENEIKQGKLILLKKEKKEQLLIGILIIILLSTFALWYLYRKQNHLYTKIVRQNQDAVRREQQLQSVITSLREQQKEETTISTSNQMTNEKYAASSLSNEKKCSLFQRLELLMQEQCIYKDNLLTKDKVAELLNTNRTYLSQAINEQTQQNFTQYINTYRINEAIRLLSDPQKDIPLKAVAAEVGFNSMTTFYKLFQNTVGMPPKQYREKVLSLHNNA